MNWRLGLDVGTNSLGWAKLDLDDHMVPYAIGAAGVRIFSDARNAKSKESNAAERRGPRSARRNRDRGKNRQKRLMNELIKFGLMPNDETERKSLEGGKNTSQVDADPWILRFRALHETITPCQLGRVIFHLSQRRGFKSNRKTDRADNEKGKVKEAIKRTKMSLAASDCRTLGEFFGKRRFEIAQANASVAKGQRKPQPLARVRKSGDGAKWQYDYYPTRELILEEFELIWSFQSSHYAEILTKEAHDAIAQTLAFQHELKPQPIGRCTLLPDEPRAAKALPKSERTRIYQEVNNLRISPPGEKERPLTLEQREKLAYALLHPKNKSAKLSFKQIRTLLGLSGHEFFNTESEKRKDLACDKTAAILMQDERWGKGWFELDAKTQNEIVHKLIETEKESELISWLKEKFGISREKAERLADAPLPDGYGSLSEKAIDRLQPHLEKEVIPYSEAATREFGNHSNFATGELFDLGLPYYGRILERSVAFGSKNPDDPDEIRFGKIANPTVHVALNQVRAVVNDLIRRFGAPKQIVIEVARDLPLSAQGKKDLEKLQKENQAANEKRAKELESIGQQNNYENRLRLRLFEEMDALGKVCVFSGKHISMGNLFTNDIQIEHLLPFALSFDDGINNLVLADKQANKDKGRRSPYEAFGHNPVGYNWEEITARVANLPKPKQWRFDPDAMERFKDEAGFMDRQLNNTRYIARLMKGYLEGIFGGAPIKGGKSNIWVVTGKLTSDLRYHWGLDSVLRGHNEEMSEMQKKNRNDHRHHAIDAIVIAMTDRSLVKMASDLAKQNDDRSLRLFDGLQEPWNGFRDNVRTAIDNIVVSHKPDHGYQGAMHNDTAHGIVKGLEGEPNNKGVRKVVTRKPLDGGFDKPEQLEAIRDDLIRQELQEATIGLEKVEFKQALIAAGEAMQPPVRRVRVIENLNVIPIYNSKSNKPYKGYKGDSNYCYDIWLAQNGKWTGRVISTFEAYQRARIESDWWKQLKGPERQSLVMRLRKSDMLQIEHEGKIINVQVAKISPGIIALAEHFEANVDARTRDKEETLKYIFKSPGSLQAANAKLLTVSPSGQIKLHH